MDSEAYAKLLAECRSIIGEANWSPAAYAAVAKQMGLLVRSRVDEAEAYKMQKRLYDESIRDRPHGAGNCVLGTDVPTVVV